MKSVTASSVVLAVYRYVHSSASARTLRPSQRSRMQAVVVYSVKEIVPMHRYVYPALCDDTYRHSKMPTPRAPTFSVKCTSQHVVLRCLPTLPRKVRHFHLLVASRKKKWTRR